MKHLVVKKREEHGGHQVCVLRAAFVFNHILTVLKRYGDYGGRGRAGTGTTHDLLYLLYAALCAYRSCSILDVSKRSFSLGRCVCKRERENVVCRTDGQKLSLPNGMVCSEK